MISKRIYFDIVNFFIIYIENINDVIKTSVLYEDCLNYYY